MNIVSQPYGDAGVAQICNFRQINVLVTGHSSARQSMGDPQVSWNLQKPTFDERISNVIGRLSPYQSMYLGSNATLAMQYGEPEQLMTCSSLGIPIDTPEETFRTFFGNLPSVRGMQAYQQLFDFHRKKLDSMRTKFSQNEAQRLEQHLAALENYERVGFLAEEALPVCNLPDEGYVANSDPLDTIERGKVQADLLVLALQCGLTKVATLQIGDNKAYYAVPKSGYAGEVHGGAVHGSFDSFAYDAVMRYHHEVPAYLIKKLMETEGADGKKLIDSTVVAVVNCMGDGRDSSPENSPWLLATRMPGFRGQFSAQRGGDTHDFHAAIVKGLGYEGEIESDGRDDLDLLS